MKQSYDQSQVPQPLEVLRKAGYSPFRDPKTGQSSFVLRLTSGFYPRFHLYLEEEGNTVTFSLHLDQKKPSYLGTHAHGGEYEGPKVEKEMQRINGWVRSGKPPSLKTKKSGLFGGIFG